MAEKARDAFRTISEVANWLDVPAHVLRFWESKFPQIKPVKRAGGRRYYRPADMRLIGGIKTLLHDDGLTIRGVQKMLKEDGIKSISDLAPSLDMPSEEEGAARRHARRARRQARQDARSAPQAAATQPVEAAPEQTSEEEAPFTHVEDTPPGGDNVVSLGGPREAEVEPELDETEAPDNGDTQATFDTAPPEEEREQDVVDIASDEAVTDALPDMPSDEHAFGAETQEDTSTDDVQDAEPPAETPIEPVAESPVDLSAEDTLVEEHANAEPFEASVEAPEDAPAPISTIPEPQVAAEETPEPEPARQPEPVADMPEQVAEPAAAPQPDIPADPDPTTITLTEAQIATAGVLKQLRRHNSKGAESDALKRAALDKLADLRAQMASHLG